MHFGIKVIAVIMLVVYLRIFVSKYGHETLLSFILLAVFFIIFLSYNILLVYFHKKGFYTPEQATEFYTKCCEQNISLIQEENFEKATDIYFSIFGTDKYFGVGTLLTHMLEIYNVGKEITKE